MGHLGSPSLKHEHPLLTMTRETFEEFGINVLNGELLTSINVIVNSKADSFDYHIYMITDHKRKPVNCSKEHTEIKWFKRKEINKISIALPQFLEVLDDWLKGQNDKAV